MYVLKPEEVPCWPATPRWHSWIHLNPGIPFVIYLPSSDLCATSFQSNLAITSHPIPSSQEAP